MVLWTRRPFSDGRAQATLHVEVAEDAAFHRVIAAAEAAVSEESDWTCRVLVGGLKPDHRLLVPVHRQRRRRQPPRPNHHRAKNR